MSEPRERQQQERDDDDGEEMVMFLERDQLMSDRRRPLPPAEIGPRAHAALWTLRIFVLIIGLMVIFTFCAKL
jgi:hypothetical protein